MAMKIFHTSDWHLGKMLYGKSLMEDQKYFIHQVFLKEVENRKPDLVLIAGDIYDKQIAPADAIMLFDEVMIRLTEMGVKTAVISGNHDSAQRLALMKPLLRKMGAYISTSLEDALQPVTVEAGGESASIFLLPFLDNAQVRDYFKDDSLRGEAACMQRVIEELESVKSKLELPENNVNILMAHCFVIGGVPVTEGSSVFAGGSGNIPVSIMEGFDYTALGHLHGAQRVGRGRYSGTPLKFSVDEEHHKKSFTELIIENGEITHTLVPIPHLRDVRRITGLFEDILQQGIENPTDDYTEIVLTDKQPILFAAQKLSPYYPNHLAVRNEWAMSQARNGNVKREKDADERTLFKSFMKDICNAETGGAEEELFAEILEEVLRPCL